jgi:glyoxylase-like metal-dependent hydrolase (beta-lactamase superfamily II)
MRLKTLVTGVLQVNTYLLVCEESAEGVVIDPGDDGERIWRCFEQEKAALKYIINTHGHPDHIMANNYLKERSQAPIVIHREDAQMLVTPDPLMLAMVPGGYVPTPADVKLQEGDKIQVGKLSLQVVHTPGHTPGGISLLTDGVVFSGDTLFAGGIGRTDLPGGSYPTLINSIKEKLFCLDPGLQVLPGHGPASTIKEEMEHNPFLTDRGFKL